MSDKIQPTHLEREAYVYVRQSSMSQVRNHLESQDRQYGLAEKANVTACSGSSKSSATISRPCEW